MPILGVNIDHVATIRQARYREVPDSPNASPDPVEAALIAEQAGAKGITAHLREDRRHIQDRDILRLREKITTKLNLEMGASEEIARIALEIIPDDVCLVPENRREVTTEGGLNCADQLDELRPLVARLKGRGIRVSLFIDPDEAQIEAAAELGADFVEIHTGAYANAAGSGAELKRLITAAGLAVAAGLRVNAGHGLNYHNLRPVLAMSGLEELNIGHSIVSRAVIVGMAEAVREMCSIIAEA
ncbi:MAG: pyridoxine 5'-phosphate synthase [Verrucomicrobiaceae bacterium]|nr:MAG: pyridoxine 5'-phosphate synthase [Verrucomicrobiaceae bacterium]